MGFNKVCISKNMGFIVICVAKYGFNYIFHILYMGLISSTVPWSWEIER